MTGEKAGADRQFSIRQGVVYNHLVQDDSAQARSRNQQTSDWRYSISVCRSSEIMHLALSLSARVARMKLDLANRRKSEKISTTYLGNLVRTTQHISTAHSCNGLKPESQELL